MATPLTPSGVPSMAAINAAIPHVQAGGATVTVGTSTNVFTQAVSFPREFPVGTDVYVTVTQRQGSGHFYAAWVTTRSTTGFELRVTKSGSSGATSITVDWIAVAV